MLIVAQLAKKSWSFTEFLLTFITAACHSILSSANQLHSDYISEMQNSPILNFNFTDFLVDQIYISFTYTDDTYKWYWMRSHCNVVWTNM